MLAKLDKLIRLNTELIDKLLRFGAIIQLFFPINRRHLIYLNTSQTAESSCEELFEEVQKEFLWDGLENEGFCKWALESLGERLLRCLTAFCTICRDVREYVS